MPFVETWMEVEILILSEVSLKEKETCHITYMWSLKYGINDLSSEQKQIMDMESRLVFVRRKWGVIEIDVYFWCIDPYDGWGVWVDRCRLLHLEQMGDGVLLCSTGNCVQSLVLEYDGK